MRNYSFVIKQTALEKIVRPGANLSGISLEMDIPKDTLYFWLRKAKTGSMRPNQRRTRKTLSEKMKIILEVRSLKDEELGKWLREKGFHESQIETWEREIQAALERMDGQSNRERELQKENQELGRELTRKEKALAEMSALLVLKKN